MLSGSRNNLAYIGFTKYKPCNFSIGWPSRCSKSEVCSLAYWTSEQKRRRDQATRHHLPKRVDGNDFAKIQSSFCSKFILKVWNTYRLKVKGEKKDRQENLNIYLLNSQKKKFERDSFVPQERGGSESLNQNCIPCIWPNLLNNGKYKNKGEQQQRIMPPIMKAPPLPSTTAYPIYHSSDAHALQGFDQYCPIHDRHC